MRYLALLAVVVIILPVRGQEERPKTASHKTNPRNTNKPSVESAPTVPNVGVNVVHQETSAALENSPKDHPKSYLSRLFSPENLPNVGLFVIGTAGVIIALCTLAAINRQAREMAEQRVVMAGQLREMQSAGFQTASLIEQAGKQVDALKTVANATENDARAAKASADALVNSERAWVMAELGWYERLKVVEGTTTVGGDSELSTTAIMKLTCRNDGRTPAWIDHVRGGMDIVSGGSLVDTPPNPQTLSNFGPMRTLRGGGEQSRSLELTCPGHRKAGEFLSVYVLIEYHDIFEMPRETSLGYSIDSSGSYRQDALTSRNRNI